MNEFVFDPYQQSGEMPKSIIDVRAICF